MEKTISFFNELGMAAYSAIVLCVGYFMRWFLLKLKSLIVQDVWKMVDERIELQMKSIADLAIKNEEKLEDVKNFQNDIYQKFREVKHEIKNNTESSINHQVLDSLSKLQDYINQSNKNDK
jgi:hypothetical protein